MILSVSECTDCIMGSLHNSSSIMGFDYPLLGLFDESDNIKIVIDGKDDKVLIFKGALYNPAFSSLLFKDRMAKG